MATRLSLCARAAVARRARWLSVTSVEKGVAARSLSRCEKFSSLAEFFRGRPGRHPYATGLRLIAWELWHLDELESELGAAAAQSIPVHLEIDTGMSRQGARSRTSLQRCWRAFRPTLPAPLSSTG